MSRAKAVYDWFDTRLDLENGQKFLGKAFPAEDSFLLGEVALFCFLLLILSGVFLGFFFEPSTSDVEYEGSVQKFQGQEMPEAFVSVLHITYDVPFGMFIRRLHHWAAHLFVASIGLHMLRVFFTGAYQNPREPNWVVGVGLCQRNRVVQALVGLVDPSNVFRELFPDVVGVDRALVEHRRFAGRCRHRDIQAGVCKGRQRLDAFFAPVPVLAYDE